jgi:glycosidase
MSADPFCYRAAIIYELYVQTFSDGNRDGIADFTELTQALDYVERLA